MDSASVSPWDEPHLMDKVPMEPIIKANFGTFVGILYQTGMVFLASFGALFLMLLFMIFTSALWEHSRANLSDPDDTREIERPSYHFHIPENSNVSFYTAADGQLRQIRSQRNNLANDNLVPLITHPTMDANANRRPDRSRTILESTSQRSMEVQGLRSRAVTSALSAPTMQSTSGTVPSPGRTNSTVTTHNAGRSRDYNTEDGNFSDN